LISVNKDWRCIIWDLVKDRGGHLVNQPRLSSFEQLEIK